ncbi:replication protein A 70 kDa DNA-binding subunit C-like [Helianthus annuus]|uniref:replication protein A 70 kDa DNA-binding subunit C-like n=1 Tax=Helianthus annuus TaxID=4232 RepID=UPI001652CB5F|nr:replication protein A 70 kDa DNA-binding subunit C-like [Helianthus annuus]
MICMDEEGHQIQASCMHRILPRLQEYFKLDECLLITRPSLAPNNSTYNYTKNNQKLTFSFFTQIQKSQDWNGPKYNFSFVNFKDVVQNRLEVNTTVDFIGYVEVCFNLEDTNKKDGTKGKRLNVKLKDLENHQIIGTLWDEFAIRMHAYFNAENREKYVVMVVHFGVVNLYKGKRGLSTSFDISRIFIDTDIDEITTFRQSGG